MQILGSQKEYSTIIEIKSNMPYIHNILVTGANGQLGSELKELAPLYSAYHFLFTDSRDLDITDHSAVNEFVCKNEINAIINCAAYTQVDKAESEPTKANAINYLAVENLAKISKARGITLIHISTDYVFDGISDRPYTEEDVPNPQNIYGKTKLAGEKAMLRVNPTKSIIIRTSWVYSSYGNNFVKTMISLSQVRESINVITDQRGSPTYAGDLARTILEILAKIKNKDVEIYHYANEGVCSWYDFAKAIFEIHNITVKILAVDTGHFRTFAKRPLYSLLNKNKIKDTFKIEIPYWRDSLVDCLQKVSS